MTVNIDTADGVIATETHTCACGALVRLSAEDIAYEATAYGSYRRHTCPEAAV